MLASFFVAVGFPPPPFTFSLFQPPWFSALLPFRSRCVLGMTIAVKCQGYYATVSVDQACLYEAVPKKESGRNELVAA